MDLAAIKQRMEDVYGSPATSESSLYTRVINDAYRTLAGTANWWWLTKKGIIRTLPSLAKTMTATNGAATLTPATDNQIGTSYVGGQLYSGGHTYRITAVLVTAPYTVTLDANWIETSGSYDLQIWKDTYSLPSDFSYATAVTVRSDPNHLPLRFVTEEEIDFYGPERYSTAYDQARTCCVRKDLAVGTTQLIQFYPAPSLEREYLVTYYANITELASDGDVPAMPERFHDVLCALAVTRMLKIDREDPDVIAHWDNESRMGMARMLEEQSRQEPKTYRFGRRGYQGKQPLEFKVVNTTTGSV